jgi:hypothetical protein
MTKDAAPRVPASHVAGRAADRLRPARVTFTPGPKCHAMYGHALMTKGARALVAACLPSAAGGPGFFQAAAVDYDGALAESGRPTLRPWPAARREPAARIFIVTGNIPDNTSMLTGAMSPFTYPAGSQLAAALAFIRAHRSAHPRLRRRRERPAEDCRRPPGCRRRGYRHRQHEPYELFRAEYLAGPAAQAVAAQKRQPRRRRSSMMPRLRSSANDEK